jgi:hypothetical protein
MSFYQPCLNCAVERATCPRRAQVAAGIKGLGMTTVNFRCALRRPLYREGQRVQVTWKYYPPDWAYEDGCSLETWPATVVRETVKGFLIVVDDVLSDQDLPARDYIKNESLFCNVVAGKLAPLDEPDRRVCEYCGNPSDGNGGVLGTCWGEDGYGKNIAPNCLASADTHPKGGDANAAPFMSGAVPAEERADAQTQPGAPS